MACISKRRNRWVIDFYDNQGMKPTNQEAAIRLENTIFQINGSKMVAETV